MLNALAKVDASALESIKSVILVGNPYRIPGKKSNVNAAAQHDKKASVGMFAEPAIASNSTIPQLAMEVDNSGKVLDYCIEVSIRYPSLQLVLLRFADSISFLSTKGRSCLLAQPCLLLPNPCRSPFLWIG